MPCCLGSKASLSLMFSRRDWIRTSALYYPKVVRYRAALHAERLAKLQVSDRTAIVYVTSHCPFSFTLQINECCIWYQILLLFHIIFDTCDSEFFS
jgi:hypothetical protein